MPTITTIDRDETVEEWCTRHHYSRSQFYAIRPEHRPRVLRVPGLRAARITAAADREWEAKMHKLSESAAGRREAERRSQQASMAGKIAAKSPLHWTNRQAAKAKAKEA